MSNSIQAVTRRRLLQSAAAAAAIKGGLGAALAQDAGPIRIGVLNTFTKSAAVYGEVTLRGMQLYLDGVGGKIAGRQVELIKEDDEFNPQVGLQKLRKLTDSDRVHIICGPLGSHIASAMVSSMKQTGIPWIVNGAGATALTKERIPNMYRATLSNWQVAYPMGSWVFEHGIKEVVVVASDFLAGHDIADAFSETFTKAGGKVMKSIFPPVGSTDFSAYLADIRGLGAPAVYAFFAGSEAGRFVRDFQQFGLKDKSKLLGFQSLLDSDTFPLQGASAIGGLSSSIYAETLDTPENNAFVALYRAKHKGLPGIFGESGYTTMRIIDDAAKAVGGKLEDREAFVAAIGRTNIVAPRGPIRFDPQTHQAIQNVYIREAVAQNGEPINKVIETVRDVGDNPANKA